MSDTSAPTRTPVEPGTDWLSKGWSAVSKIRVATATTWVLLLIALIVNVSLQPTFFTAYGLVSNFATILPPAIIAVAQTFVILSGGIDLSIGAVVTLASVVGVVIVDGDISKAPLAILAAIATGVACGAFNGFVIAVVRLQPIIATFATSFLFNGMALLVMKKPGGSVPSEMTSGYRMLIAGIPFTLISLVAVALVWIVLKRTKLLRHTYAIGDDATSAYASLVPVTRVRIFTYMLAGGFAGLAAVALFCNTGAGDPFVGADLALTSIAAVVVGGTALSGGRGGAIGSIAGAIILVLVGNIISFAGVPTTYRLLVNGLVVIAALAVSAMTARRGRKGA